MTTTAITLTASLTSVKSSSNSRESYGTPTFDVGFKVNLEKAKTLPEFDDWVRQNRYTIRQHIFHNQPKRKGKNDPTPHYKAIDEIPDDVILSAAQTDYAEEQVKVSEINRRAVTGAIMQGFLLSLLGQTVTLHLVPTQQSLVDLLTDLPIGLLGSPAPDPDLVDPYALVPERSLPP